MKKISAFIALFSLVFLMASCGGKEWEYAALPECSPSSGTPCKDSSSRLVWSKKSSSDELYSKAVSYCENYSEDGLSGWHLPDIDELRTLLITERVSANCPVSEKNNCLSLEDCWSCEICTETGTQSKTEPPYCYSWGITYDDGRYCKLGEPDWFWSSSTRTDDTEYAWVVNFYQGNVESDDKERNTLSVRCVIR